MLRPLQLMLLFLLVTFYIFKYFFLSYYIDRCELWGFIREINSGISHVKYQFFPAGRGSAGMIFHLENVKSYMSYLQQYINIIKMLTLKTYFS
jgi:hypothetical protein